MTFAHLPEVLAEVAPLSDRFRDANFRLFLVGGIVRDQLLDHGLDASSDIDLTTNARPADIKRIVGGFAEDLWTQGERFGTIGLRADGRDIEITTHRAEQYDHDSRKPEVSFGDDVEVDLSRRDFTVNAMAIELPAGELVDPYGGAEDLANKVLRTPLDADISFSDDPLRMMRAARFATKYSLEPTEDLVRSATDLHERIRIVAIERIGVELRRLLSLSDPRKGISFLADTGLLAEVLAYSEPGLIGETEAALDDSLVTLARLVESPEVEAASWHMRLAIFGLAMFGNADGAAAMAQRLRLSQNDWREIVGTCQLADTVLALTTVGPADVRRWVHTDRDGQAAAALVLAKAIAPTSIRVAEFSDLYADMSAEGQFDDVTFIDGAAIMKVLDVGAGPGIGKALKHLHERYYEHGPMTDELQVDELRRWASSAST